MTYKLPLVTETLPFPQFMTRTRMRTHTAPTVNHSQGLVTTVVTTASLAPSLHVARMFRELLQDVSPGPARRLTGDSVP